MAKLSVSVDVPVLPEQARDCASDKGMPNRIKWTIVARQAQAQG